MKDFQYYRIHRKNDESIPLLDSDDGNPDYLYEDRAIDSPKLMLFKLGKPIPKKPKLVDYHSTPSSVVSRKIYDILSPLAIEGIQLLPARIRGKNDEIVDNYWAVHVFNTIKCVDLEQSDCDMDSLNIMNAKKIILKKEILTKIPLKKRLIFRLVEDFAYQLYHVSIVEKIIESNPEGVGFTDIELWNESTLFK